MLTHFTNIALTEEPAGVADDDYSDDDNFGGDVDQDLFGKLSRGSPYVISKLFTQSYGRFLLNEPYVINKLFTQSYGRFLLNEALIMH